MSVSRDPRVAIDVWSCLGHGTGICRFIVDLAVALLGQGVDLRGWCLTSDREPVLDPSLQALSERLPLQLQVGPREWLYGDGGCRLWRYWPGWLPVPQLLPRDIDLFHATLYPLPLAKAIPTVITVQDLIGLHNPEWTTAEGMRVYRCIADLADRTTRVMASSEATRRDLLEFSRVDPARVSVVPLGVGERFFQPVDEARVEEIRRRYGLRRPYILAVGTTPSRKNLDRLVRAFTLVCPQVPDVELALAGFAPEPRSPLALALSETRNPRVHALDYVPDQHIRPLLAGALALAYPSLYEGFGLPVLEAMAGGIPVICSDTSSLPEVAGDAALLFDPTNLEAMAEAVRSVATEESLREELRRRGLQRAHQFTWERTAERVVAVYREALE